MVWGSNLEKKNGLGGGGGGGKFFFWVGGFVFLN